MLSTQKHSTGQIGLPVTKQCPLCLSVLPISKFDRTTGTTTKNGEKVKYNTYKPQCRACRTVLRSVRWKEKGRSGGHKRGSRVKASTSFVYFISDGDFIKIGKANNPSSRLSELQTGNARQLILLNTIECDGEDAGYRLEARLQQLFSGIKALGEWFVATPDLFNFIISTKPTV